MIEAMREDYSFVVDNDQKAEWAIKQIASARMEADMWEAHYQREAQKVRERADETVAYMTGLLKAYFDTVPHKHTKTQENYILPSGKLVCKAQQPKYLINDDATCSWLEQQGRSDLVKVTRKADWAELKKSASVLADGTVILTATGEVIDGVTAELREPVFTVEMKKGGANDECDLS